MSIAGLSDVSRPNFAIWYDSKCLACIEKLSDSQVNLQHWTTKRRNNKKELKTKTDYHGKSDLSPGPWRQSWRRKSIWWKGYVKQVDFYTKRDVKEWGSYRVTYFLSSDIAVYVLKRDVKLQPTNIHVRPWIWVIYQCMCNAQALTHCWLRISELEMITAVILWSSLGGLRRCWFFLRYRRYINHLLAYLLTFIWHVKCQCTALL